MTQFHKEQAKNIYSDNFTNQELWSKDNLNIIMEEGFIESLEELRFRCGFPLHPTRVCSTVEHNARIGGHRRSLHLMCNPSHRNIKTGEALKTCAADLFRPEKHLTAQIIQHALGLGWSVLVYDNHLHIDLRTKYIGYRQIFDTVEYGE